MAPKDDNRKNPYNNTKEHWHLSKGINVSYIASILALFASGIIYIDDIKDRADAQDNRIDHVEEVQDLRNNQVQKQLEDLSDKQQENHNEMNQNFKTVDDKLDGIKDYLLKRNGSG